MARKKATGRPWKTPVVADPNIINRPTMLRTHNAVGKGNNFQPSNNVNITDRPLSSITGLGCHGGWPGDPITTQLSRGGVDRRATDRDDGSDEDNTNGDHCFGPIILGRGTTPGIIQAELAGTGFDGSTRLLRAKEISSIFSRNDEILRSVLEIIGPKKSSASAKSRKHNTSASAAKAQHRTQQPHITEGPPEPHSTHNIMQPRPQFPPTPRNQHCPEAAQDLAQMQESSTQRFIEICASLHKALESTKLIFEKYYIESERGGPPRANVENPGPMTVNQHVCDNANHLTIHRTLKKGMSSRTWRRFNGYSALSRNPPFQLKARMEKKQRR